MTLFVDADNLGARQKEILVKAAVNRCIRCVFVACHEISLPADPNLNFRLVSQGQDAVDRAILKELAVHDILVTADIPFAALAVGAGAIVIHPRGDLFTRKNIADRIASQKLINSLKAFGPVPVKNVFGKKDPVKTFADTLDRELTRGQKAGQTGASVGHA